MLSNVIVYMRHAFIFVVVPCLLTTPWTPENALKLRDISRELQRDMRGDGNCASRVCASKLGFYILEFT